MDKSQMLVAAMAGIAVGYFCLGRLWEMRRTHFWRFQWIKLEHESARLEGRKPHDITTIKET